MGRPRKVKPAKIAKPSTTERTPLTIEVHGETIDLDLKLMLDSDSKSDTFDKTLTKILTLISSKLGSHTGGIDIDDDDDDLDLDKIIGGYVKQSSDIELSIVYRKVIEEMRARGISRPSIPTEYDAPEPTEEKSVDEQPSS